MYTVFKYSYNTYKYTTIVLKNKKKTNFLHVLKTIFLSPPENPPLRFNVRDFILINIYFFSLRTRIVIVRVILFSFNLETLIFIERIKISPGIYCTHKMCYQMCTIF